MTRALMALLMIATTVAPAFAEEATTHDRGPILSVKGEGKIEVKPDLAEFTVVVSVTQPTTAAATAGLPEKAARAEALLKSLAADGVEILRSDYSLLESRPNQFVPLGTKPAEPSSTASIQYSLKISRLDALSTLFTKINSAGLLQMHGVRFYVTDPRATQNRARAAAFADALEQGKAYSDAAGVKLDQVMEITDDDAVPPDGQADLNRPAGMPITIIAPATLTFTAGVSVIWKIAPRS